MTDYKTTCQICGKEYDNYMRTFYVEENGKRTIVCIECRNEFCKDKFVYTNHIPDFCDGGNLVSHCFKTEEELLQYVTSSTDENSICCMGYDGAIVNVSKSIKAWWVRGFSTLSKGTLPNWRDKVKELYGEL